MKGNFKIPVGGSPRSSKNAGPPTPLSLSRTGSHPSPVAHTNARFRMEL